MNYVFISPNFPENFWNFCDRLNKNGVNVLGVGESSYDELPNNLKDCLTEYYRVDSLENYDLMVRAIGYFTHKYGKIDWIESNNEYWLELDSKLRTDFNINTGIKSEKINDIKAKSAMKKFYELAKVKTARYHLCSTLEKAKEFITEVDFPVIVKPDIGVGANATYKLENNEQLTEFFNNLSDTPYIMEEFVEGIIYSYDGIVNQDGVCIYDTSHVFPPIMDVVNDCTDIVYYSLIDIPKDVALAGKRTLEAFDIRGRCFHFEFFKLAKTKKNLGKAGDLIGLEVNMRTPGGFTPDMMNFASDIDIYQIYADMVTLNKNNYDDFTRLYHCAFVSRRDYYNYAVSNEEILKKYGDAIVSHGRCPDALSSAMGNNYYMVRLKSIDEVEQFAKFVQKQI